MSLLKVSLCINRPKQRLLCMDTGRGCRSKRSTTPLKNKNIFCAVWGAFLLLFFHGEGFMLRFSSYEGLFFIVWRPFCYFFFTWGPFCYVFLLVWGLFHNMRVFFAIFSPFGGTFLSSWGILCLYGFFYGRAPSPYDFCCGQMLLCNFHPMSSAITYSGHYVPNKAHCNTRVQFTITMK